VAGAESAKLWSGAGTGRGGDGSQTRQRRRGIAEPLGLHPHAVQQRQVQPAQFAVLIAAARVALTQL